MHLRRMLHFIGFYDRGSIILNSELLSCKALIFGLLVAKLKTNVRGEFEIRFYVRDHVNHSSFVDLSSVSKWFNCETANVL